MKTNSNKALFAARVSVGSLIASMGLMVPHAALAQGAAKPAAAAEDSADKPGDIIVTGSRITKAGFTAPTPTTVVGVEAIEARAAVAITNILYELPSVRPSPAPTGVSQTGGNFVNLRSLGSDQAAGGRTLVLLNGRRFVPTNNVGQVDLNVIPTSLVERIDVVTGGASAAYGSDAVSGVVNIILKRKLNGFQGDVQYGQSGHNDNKQFKASLAWGTSFAEDRGQFMVAGEFSNLTSPVRQGDRTYSNKHSGYVYSAAAGAYVQQDGLVLSGYSNGGIIIASNGAALATTSPLFGKQFLGIGPVAPSAATLGTAILTNTGTTVSGVRIGGDGGWLGDFNLLSAPNKRQSVFARGSYEITPDLSIWAEGSYSQTESGVDLFLNSVKAGVNAGEAFITQRTQLQRYDAAGVLLAGTTANPFLDAATITAAANQPISIGRLTPELGNLHTETRVRVIRGALGFDGNIGDNWRYSASYTHGETNFNTDFSNVIIEPNLAASLDIVDFNGTVTCRINVPGQAAALAANSSSRNADSGCLAANPFGPGSLAPRRGYLTGTLANLLIYKQDAAAASIQGEPFSTWAGPVSIAVGGEWRKESLVQTVSPKADLLSLAFPSGQFQQANPKSFAGGFTVKEGFGEIAVPLARDASFAHSLDLNGAIRVTDYSSSGSVTTWKVGGTWSPVAGLLFRATRSRDIRAPNISQASGSATQFATLRDNSSNGAGANIDYTALVRPGVGLAPEVADTLTFGASLTHKGLSLSVDVFSIKLDKFIGGLGAQNALDFCYGPKTTDVGNTGRTGAISALNLALCDAYVGNGTAGSGLAAIAGAGPHVVINPTVNNGFIRTKGADVEVAYRLPLSQIFPNSNAVLTSRFLATYTDSLVIATLGAAAVDRVGDISGAPDLRWTLTETLTNGPLSISAQGRYLSGLDLNKTLLAAQAPVNRIIPPVFYLNMGIQYRIIDRPGRRVEIYGDINNLLDRDPPFAGGIGGVSQTSSNSAVYTNNSFYDVVGRTFTIGARFKF